MVSTNTEQVEIIVNGEVRSIQFGATLREVLTYLQVNPEQVAVEKDGGIVRKSEWESTVVEAGARLEIVQFVGGG